MRKNKGFTLIELLIVITIIGILTVLGARQFGNAVARANATADLANAQTIANAARQALLMNELTGADTISMAAPTAVTPAEDNTTAVAAITKYLGSVPEIKSAASLKNWVITFDAANQSVVVKVDGNNLSPRGDLSATIWNVAQ